MKKCELCRCGISEEETLCDECKAELRGRKFNKRPPTLAAELSATEVLKIKNKHNIENYGKAVFAIESGFIPNKL